MWRLWWREPLHTRYNCIPRWPLLWDWQWSMQGSRVSVSPQFTWRWGRNLYCQKTWGLFATMGQSNPDFLNLSTIDNEMDILWCVCGLGCVCDLQPSIIYLTGIELYIWRKEKKKQKQSSMSHYLQTSTWESNYRTFRKWYRRVYFFM